MRGQKNRCEYYTDTEIYGLYRKCTEVEGFDRVVIVSELTDLNIDDVIDILTDFLTEEEMNKYASALSDKIIDMKKRKHYTSVAIADELHISKYIVDNVIKRYNESEKVA